MTTDEYKNIFSKSGKDLISITLNDLLNNDKYEELYAYLTGEKNIDDVNIDKLYEIKTEFSQLEMSCKLIQRQVQKLNLSFRAEFEDQQIELNDIGINKNDQFQCISDLKYLNTITISEGSIIKITGHSFKGKDRVVYCEMVKHVTDDQTQELLPDINEIEPILTLSELEHNFKPLRG